MPSLDSFEKPNAYPIPANKRVALNVVVLGARGRIGSRIVAELVRRGHHVTPVVRRPDVEIHHISGVVADINDSSSLADLLSGHDAVVSALGVPGEGPGRRVEFVQSGLTVLEGARSAGVKRVLIVGGGGSLEISPGVQWLDSGNFLPGNPRQPTDALAHRDLLTHLRSVDDLDWTCVSPPMRILPGERSGTYRTRADTMVFDEHGVSQISMEDYAVALVDELESGDHIKQRFTAAY